MSKKKKPVYARIACMTVGEVKNRKFYFQLNIITTLIFGNQFCPYQELLWLHFIVIIIIKKFIIIMGATDRRLRRTRLILYLASGYRDWAVLMLKKSGF